MLSCIQQILINCSEIDIYRLRRLRKQKVLQYHLYALCTSILFTTKSLKGLQATLYEAVIVL